MSCIFKTKEHVEWKNRGAIKESGDKWGVRKRVDPISKDLLNMTYVVVLGHDYIVAWTTNEDVFNMSMNI
jgi:hypothetical protein